MRLLQECYPRWQNLLKPVLLVFLLAISLPVLIATLQRSTSSNEVIWLCHLLVFLFFFLFFFFFFFFFWLKNSASFTFFGLSGFACDLHSCTRFASVQKCFSLSVRSNYVYFCFLVFSMSLTIHNNLYIKYVKHWFKTKEKMLCLFLE